MEAAYVPLIELTRGQTVESLHHGAFAVVDARGELVMSAGDPQAFTFMRSSSKPFQALPFIEAGGDTHYQLTSEETAILCASHSGTDRHVEVVASIQQKAGISEELLQCGTHDPYDPETARRLILSGQAPAPIRHNCSGKHTGMLAFARMKEESLEDYLDPGHPLQVRILKTLTEMSGAPEGHIQLGIDGCSAPNFALSLIYAARAWARFADPDDQPPARAAACRTLFQAMYTHPEMVGGPGRFDTLLMAEAGGKLVSKVGAEGFLGIGILPGVVAPGSPGLGIALKIADGDGFGRARGSAALSILSQLGVLSAAELRPLAEFGPVKAVTNRRNLTVGEMRPIYKLN